LLDGVKLDKTKLMGVPATVAYVETATGLSDETVVVVVVVVVVVDVVVVNGGVVVVVDVVVVVGTEGFLVA